MGRKIDYDKFIRELIRYRAKHNLSMKEMAKLCGVTTITIWNIENNSHKPNMITVYKIKEIIGDKE